MFKYARVCLFLPLALLTVKTDSKLFYIRCKGKNALNKTAQINQRPEI
jgi:hypothetical protein